MRKILILGWILIFVSGACSPSAPIASTPTGASTIAPTAMIENPPACTEAELELRGEL
jgi:hypothetical protein